MSTMYEAMKRRHSVRTYDPNFQLSEEQLLTLLEEATTAPSSSNLQPWRFIVFHSESAKRALRPIANDQRQVEEASAVIAIVGNRKMYEQVERIQAQNVAEGHLNEQQKEMMIQSTMRTYPYASPERLAQIASLDCGLIAMQLMLLATDKGYATVPMGGFDHEQFHETYGLESHEYPELLIAIGKEVGTAYGSSRLPAHTLTTFL
ncbi:nitroreductase family protein [Planococcaceae bacterium Storch 2/2-2]|nr:nitroreductase family protein [Planococcaceae bacterium Storch 2/2-2]